MVLAVHTDGNNHQVQLAAVRRERRTRIDW